MLSVNQSLLLMQSELQPKNIQDSSSEEIEEFNRMELQKNRIFRKLYRPVRRNIVVNTYIIPTSDGKAVTGYLVKRLKQKSTDPSALIVYIHSGGWTMGNMDKEIAVCSNICNETGAEVLAVDYRLAPQFKFPTPVLDCFDAYMWAVQGARYWRLDPSRIYLMGSCCGANLVCGVSMLARDRKVQKPAGQILIDPITDCRLRTSTMAKFQDSKFLNQKQLVFYINNYQREPKDILDPLFSPLLAKDFSRLPSTLILAAEDDILSDDAILYEQALKSADTPAKALICQGRPHGFMDYPSSYKWKDNMSAISFFIEGMGAESIEIWNRKERAKVRKTRGPVVIQA